jgi:hypothetical protein
MRAFNEKANTWLHEASISALLRRASFSAPKPDGLPTP